MAEDSDQAELLYFNGIDVTTGAYDRPPMTSEELSKVIKGEATPENLSELKFRADNPEQFGIAAGYDATKLDESGWGIIFASDANPAVKEALSELLTWREKQAGPRYHVYEGPEGHQQGENKNDFLARHGAGPGPADPDNVPYYLLIAGSPERIPFRFQSQLDLQCSVGRIHFDTLDEYANYAQSVVTAESGKVKLPRTGAFFGVANPDDRATALSAEQLVRPLFEKFSGEDDFKSWQFESFMKERANRQQLEALLGGDETPSLLFTASHGASFPLGDKRQRAGNGALVCQDWPGPRQWREALPEKFYFAGDQLSADSNLLGLIAFFFACYGGGTPKMDEYSAQEFRDSRRQIAEQEFLAQLPAKMLGRPKGGALAVMAHVERAWGYSFTWPRAGKQLAVFESTIRLLLEGHPVGSAFEYFNERYAELSADLNVELGDIKFGGKREDAFELAGMWTSNNDARGYAIIGDPAVRLAVAGEGEESSERPVIEVHYSAPPGQESAEPERAVVEMDAQAAGEAAATDFAPRPDLGRRLSARYPGLEEKMVENWVKQIERGYKDHEELFQRILDTFLSNHRATVTMYWILFLVGIGLFIAAAVLAVILDDFIPAAILGGLGVVSFLSFFVGRSVQSVEENLEYITWLGIIYNTYWTRQAWTLEQEGAQEILKDASKEALAQLEHMIDRHANARRLRPKIKD
jgi:hypothetical protein